MAVILVTGAGRGIGLELARQLAHAGHTVIAISRNISKLENSGLSHLHPVPFDLTSGNYRELLQKAETISPHIDILINNAGMVLNKPFLEIGADDMRAVYEVNVFSVVRLIQHLFPLLSRSGNAHILNISSMGGFQGAAKFPGLSIYSSSKAALTGLTECLAEEFKGTGIRVNALCLGAVQTEMLAEAFPGYQAPVGPADMAAFISAFALTGSQVMNGKVLPVALTTP